MEGMLWKPILKTLGCPCGFAATVLCTLCVYCSVATCMPTTQCCHISTLRNSDHHHQHCVAVCKRRITVHASRYKSCDAWKQDAEDTEFYSDLDMRTTPNGRMSGVCSSASIT